MKESLELNPQKIARLVGFLRISGVIVGLIAIGLLSQLLRL